LIFTKFQVLEIAPNIGLADAIVDIAAEVLYSKTI
jgi:hypothetical protein